MDDLVLPAIVTIATAPGYETPSNGLPNPAPNPAVVFLAQQKERFGYYIQGLWREMLIKLSNEQVIYLTNGGVTPGITYDMQSLPFADSHLFQSRPGISTRIVLCVEELSSQWRYNLPWIIGWRFNTCCGLWTFFVWERHGDRNIYQ